MKNSRCRRRSLGQMERQMLLVRMAACCSEWAPGGLPAGKRFHDMNLTTEKYLKYARNI